MTFVSFLFRSYILNYLANRPNLQHFVVQALVTLLAKITKYGWFDTYKNELIFQNLLEDVKTFLQVNINIHIMSVTGNNFYSITYENNVMLLRWGD